MAAAAESDTAEQVFVTVAAGVTTSYFESKLPAGAPVVRAMPNAAALVGAGVTALAKGRFVTPHSSRRSRRSSTPWVACWSSPSPRWTP